MKIPGGCPSLCLCCYDKALTKNNFGRKCSFHLTLRGNSPSVREAGKEPGVGNKNRDQKELCYSAHWLAPHSLFRSLSFTAQAHLPTHSKLGAPPSIINQEKAPTDLPTG